MNENETETELMDLAVAGDERALERLLLTHYDRLHRRIERRFPPSLRGAVAEEDILQQAFLAVFQRIGEFRREGRWAFYRWLCRIADNRLRDALRAQHAAKRGGRGEQVGGVAVGSESYEPLIEVLAGPSHTASRSVARHEALGAIQVGVAGLKDNHRRAVELRYLRGLPVAEVAEMMGTTPHAVHSLCYRALQELHAVMGRSSQYLTRK